jgi:hypothetical protein
LTMVVLTAVLGTLNPWICSLIGVLNGPYM